MPPNPCATAVPRALREPKPQPNLPRRRTGDWVEALAAQAADHVLQQPAREALALVGAT